MQDAFENIIKTGHNNLDELIQWLKDSKTIDDSNEPMQNSIRLFQKMKSKEKVDFETFVEVVEEIANEQQKPVDELIVMLMAALPQFQEALGTAAKALEESKKTAP